MRDCEYTRSGRLCEEEKAFLDTYDPNAYPKPSVTADIVTLTMDENDDLRILLIKRGSYPYKEKWALPGGFMIVDQESVTQAAKRELLEETGVRDASLRQLYTFSDPGRDPRMHVVDVAYMALVPKGSLLVTAGEEASDVGVFRISYDLDGMKFQNGSILFREADLAFDHAKIIKMAIKRLRSRIDYEPDAFWFLRNRHEFTISELKAVYEAVKNEKLDVGNFRKVFFRDFVGKGKVIDLEKKSLASKRPAALYDCIIDLENQEEYL